MSKFTVSASWEKLSSSDKKEGKIRKVDGIPYPSMLLKGDQGIGLP